MRSFRYMALAALVAAAGAAMAQDGSGDDALQGFFDEPAAGEGQGAEAEQPAEGAATAPSVLQQAQEQKAFDYSYSTKLVGGTFFGWNSRDDFADPWGNLAHKTGAAMTSYLSIDLRPLDYFRLHSSVEAYYPTDVNGTLDFGISLPELFCDYLFADTLSNRFGKYAVTWGNARLLGVADLPGRTVSDEALAEGITLSPSWVAAATPSVWLKSSLPLGPFSMTILVGAPSSAATPFFSLAGYGAMAEYVFGSTCIGLSGYYQSGFTPRAAATIKSSILGVDCFLDSSLSFVKQKSPLLSGDLGGYYRTKSGPDLTLIAELRWNGENLGAGNLVPDALAVCGLASGFAVTWSGIGGSRFDLGLEWFHDWTDSSGALVGALSLDLGSSLSLRLGFPWVYGDAGSAYVENPPSEANGFVAGLGLVATLSVAK